MPVARRDATAQQSDSEPNHVRPYIHHGVQLVAHGSHGVGDCPFCGKAGKFSVAVDSGLWRCFVCGSGTEHGGGNALVFIRLLHERSMSVHSRVLNARGITEDRRLLHYQTVDAWGACKSIVDGRTWLVPGYGVDGKLDQLYKRAWIDGAWRLLPTPGIWPEGKVHQLHMPVKDFDPKRPNWNFLEGPWDGMALWEVYQRSDTNIVAVPGCHVWRDDWTETCRGKNVTLMYDSDHPLPEPLKQGRIVRPGLDGMYRVIRKLSGVAASIKWLRWGREGYDETKPSGWDVRDYLTSSADRKTAAVELFSKVEDAPKEWLLVSPYHQTNGQPHVTAVEAVDCNSWSKCEAAWKSAMHWRQDMADTLAVGSAVCASTQQAGNQLFVDIIGSPGSGKTTMCEGWLVSRHCHHLENLSGFHSGWKMEGDRDKDCSPIARMNGKTLITPEFDIMRTSPKYAELMGQTRRVFDGKSGATYRNTDKDMLYEGLRTPWMRAGTHAIMDTDQASMGDRFLRVIISDPSSEEEKRSIIRSALRSERTAILGTANGTAASIVDPKMRLAHALTGGYVDWLRAHVEEQLQLVLVPDYVEDQCIDLAELSADLRARPNDDKRKREAHNSKELPTRLARQNIRMAMCLAVVLNKCAVDADVLRIVRKVALDTAYGHSLNIVRWLCSTNPKVGDRSYQDCGGLSVETLSMWSGMTMERLHNYLIFLREIGVLEWRQVRQSNGFWLLTDRVQDLHLRVMGG